jgi:hypothetical protein
MFGGNVDGEDIDVGDRDIDMEAYSHICALLKDACEQEVAKPLLAIGFPDMEKHMIRIAIYLRTENEDRFFEVATSRFFIWKVVKDSETNPSKELVLMYELDEIGSQLGPDIEVIIFHNEHDFERMYKESRDIVYYTQGGIMVVIKITHSKYFKAIEEKMIPQYMVEH